MLCYANRLGCINSDAVWQQKSDKMKNKAGLTEYLDTKQFSKVEKAFRKHFGLCLETTDARGKQLSEMCSSDCFPQFCSIVKASPNGRRRCLQDRLRGLNVATETGQPYICLCHAGIVLVCVPIMNGEIPLGGLFFGKCLWEPPAEVVVEYISKRLKGIRINKAELQNAIEKLPVVPGRKIHEAAEFLYILLYETANLDPQVIDWRREKSMQQSRISEFIQEKKKSGTELLYPFESERKLIEKVKIGDRTGAKEILNSFLGTILFRDPGDVNVLKARLLELLSILSRAAVEGGVDINILLKRNLDYINKVTEIDNQPDLCAWVGNALDEFIELVYSLNDARKITQVKPALDFIEDNYSEPISLGDVAKAAHLSISRLSHVFREQMDMTTVDYVNLVRINHAKRLLISTSKNCTEICFEVGFNNQSYFTRTFKNLVGMTPLKFRHDNRRSKD